MTSVPRAPEEELLRDALGLPTSAEVATLSREPLGAGSVAGFVVAADPPLTYFVDTSRLVVAEETGMLTGSAAQPEARVWLHPADPHLPALAPVAFSAAAGTLLARLGVVVTSPPEIVVYRPGRRAVLRVPAEGEVVWVKVVPPRRVERIVQTHASLRAADVPVPVVRAWSPEGLLVIDAARGTPVGHAEWDAEALLDEVDALRSDIARCALAVPARALGRRRLEWYVDRLDAVIGTAGAARARAVAAAVPARSPARAATTTVHGDLHFAQIFLDGDGRIASVIDVDTAGAGIPSDDSGAFIAHAVASAVLTPAPHDARLWDLAARALRRWGGIEPDAAPCAAAHLLGHALGAAERGDPQQAERLVTIAAAVAEGGLPELRSTKSRLTDGFDSA